MSERKPAPLARLWKRTKETAPRQKVIASTTAHVRRAKPKTEEDARIALRAEAARQGVADLSDKELKVMTEAVVTSAKDAASQAVNKGVAGVRSMWANLQNPSPEWLELPDNVAALNIRSDQTKVQVPVILDPPELIERLTADLSDRGGVRSFDCWLALENSVTLVFAGRTRLGSVDAAAAAPVFDVLARRRAWTPAQVLDGVVTVELPDQP